MYGYEEELKQSMVMRRTETKYGQEEKELNKVWLGGGTETTYG